jgi:hypothetical protein
LYPIIDKISAAALGEVDVNFWKSIYKLREKSGGPFITGWIIKFFPYLKDMVYNKHFKSFFKKEDILHKEKTQEKDFSRITGRNPFLFHDTVPDVLKIDKFHDGLSKVDFNWVTIDKALKMQLVSGIMGMSQNPDTYALSPEIGWCVKEKM